ncbi:hypothetical protein [Photobacterium leiognathi]|uniref:hypothetical protein n=1 Tax=Photobacterium leiognathi TaxID=553611 RepID=UPI0029813689|nr:hypothetical protein [Photobacterium leiognathi]
MFNSKVKLLVIDEISPLLAELEKKKGVITKDIVNTVKSVTPQISFFSDTSSIIPCQLLERYLTCFNPQRISMCLNVNYELHNDNEVKERYLIIDLYASESSLSFVAFNNTDKTLFLDCPFDAIAEGYLQFIKAVHKEALASGGYHQFTISSVPISPTIYEVFIIDNDFYVFQNGDRIGGRLTIDNQWVSIESSPYWLEKTKHLLNELYDDGYYQENYRRAIKAIINNEEQS